MVEAGENPSPPMHDWYRVGKGVRKVYEVYVW